MKRGTLLAGGSALTAIGPLAAAWCITHGHSAKACLTS